VGSGVAVTPTTDPELGPSAYPTPSTLPKSGVFDNVIKFAVPGAILLFIGTAARLLL
jgi:hypothetical protein